jgi:hypothetical protein
MLNTLSPMLMPSSAGRPWLPVGRVLSTCSSAYGSTALMPMTSTVRIRMEYLPGGGGSGV